jgi:hypothetical protein
MLDALVTGLILIGAGLVTVALVIGALFLLEKFQK